MSMKLLKTVNIKTLLIATISLLLLHLPIPQHLATAALIKPKSVLFQVLNRNKGVYQFYLELKVSIFDPEAFTPLYEEADTNLKPYEISERSYTQNVVFIRDEFLSIETQDETGKLLHIYINELGGKKLSMNLSSQRVFRDEDIFFPSLIFFTKHLAYFEKQLYRFEIAPIQLKYDNYGDMKLYRIGTDTNNIQIDPNTFKVLELQRQIQIQGRYYPLKITFSDWNRSNETIPELTKYYVNSRLFKEIRIINLQFGRRFITRRQIVEKYQDLFPTLYPFSFEVNYGQ